MTAQFPQLDEYFPLTPAPIRAYRENGHVTIRQCLDPELLLHFGKIISDIVIAKNTQTKPMAERTTYEKAFLQVMNLWRHDEAVKAFVFSKRLARIAAELMGTRGTRLYHDQALYKEPGGGITPWHADQYYWPFKSPNTITIWVPLQDTPLEMGPVTFAQRSQRSDIGRDLVISDDSEQVIQKAVTKLNFNVTPEPFALGDVSFHSGWTIHRAGSNDTAIPRRVMTMIYMDKDIRIAEPKHAAQKLDHEIWLDSRPIGSIPDSPLNPILYEE